MNIRKTSLCVAALLLMASVGGGTLPAAAESTGAIITFEENQVTSNSADVTIEGTTATITASGSYTLSGTCDQGKLVIDADGKVTLVLDTLTLASADGPVIDIRDAKEVTISLPADTHSTLTDAAQYTSAADGQDAAIFSKADLIINGEGALTVNGQYNDGIASRDTLLIEGGDITVHAKNHGIKGKDYLIITGGVIRVDAGGDGLKATNEDQATLGYVQIDGGTLQVTAQDDGISAVSQLTVHGGDISIDTANNGMKSEGGLTITAGKIYIRTADDDFVSEAQSISDAADVTVEKR